MRTFRVSTTLAAVIAATAGSVLVGTGTAHAADVALPAVEDNRVSVRVDDPIPGKIWPLEIGQSCAGALVPPYALPTVASDVIPMLDGDILDIIRGLGDLNDAVTVLLLGGTLLPATLPGVAGTLAADDVRDDFYLVPVICAGGRDDAPMETNLFLTQVGSPLGAFEGSVTGSVGLGSAELGVGSDQGSAGELDTSSLTSSVELPAGSSNGSSIDVGSIIPIATDVAGSIGATDLPGS